MELELAAQNWLDDNSAHSFASQYKSYADRCYVYSMETTGLNQNAWEIPEIISYRKEGKRLVEKYGTWK